jgi:hypothetical protein
MIIEREGHLHAAEAVAILFPRGRVPHAGLPAHLDGDAAVRLHAAVRDGALRHDLRQLVLAVLSLRAVECRSLPFFGAVAVQRTRSDGVHCSEVGRCYVNRVGVREFDEAVVTASDVITFDGATWGLLRGQECRTYAPGRSGHEGGRGPLVDKVRYAFS